MFTVSERTGSFVIEENGQDTGVAVYVNNHAAREAFAKGRTLPEISAIEQEELGRCKAIAVRVCSALNKEAV